MAINKDTDSKDQALLENLAEKILQAFNIQDQEKFLKEAKELDQSLQRNKITPHLSQWAMTDTPVCAGKNFVITRSWKRDLVKQDPAFQNRRAIEIDPCISFGWSHETTLLTLELLEDYWQGGRLLDVGTGTGILAIAAAFLKPEAKIEAFDISQDVVDDALTHLELNGVLDKVDLKQANISDYPAATYDLITANLLPSIFVEIKEELVKRLKPGGKIIISGFSNKDEIRTIASFDWSPMVSDVSNAETSNMTELFQKQGLELIDKRQNKYWLALLMKLPNK